MVIVVVSVVLRCWISLGGEGGMVEEFCGIFVRKKKVGFSLVCRERSGEEEGKGEGRKGRERRGRGRRREGWMIFMYIHIHCPASSRSCVELHSLCSYEIAGTVY